jgi:hypothetical protein
MHKIYTMAAGLTLAVWQSGCAARSDTALTQWGTPCSDYGLTAKQCHARFANYSQFLAQSEHSTQTAVPESK